jgi:hypothetical protein
MHMAESHRPSRGINWNAVTALCTLTLAGAAIVALWFTERQISALRTETERQISEFHEEAKIQHLNEQIDKFEGPRMTAIRRSLAEKRMDLKEQRLKELDASDPPGELLDELNFCDDIGLLTSRGFLDLHDAWSEFSYWLFPLYADSRSVVDAARNDEHAPASYINCSELMENMLPIEKSEDAGSDDHPSEPDIYAFYLDERDAEVGQSPRRSKRSGP